MGGRFLSGFNILSAQGSNSTDMCYLNSTVWMELELENS